MKRIKKFIAVILSVIIVSQSFTTVALAAEQPPHEAKTQLATNAAISPEDEEENEPQAHIISEDPEKRTIDTKTFLKSDGTFLRAVYNEPIHFKDSSDHWQDIDNTLIKESENTNNDVNSSVEESKPESSKPSESKAEIKNEESKESVSTVSGSESKIQTSETEKEKVESTEKSDNINNSSSSATSKSRTKRSIIYDSPANSEYLENKASDVKIKISETIQPGNTVSVNTGKHLINWGIDNVNNVKSEIVPQKDTSNNSDDQFLTLKKLHNEVIYKEALPGINVQYIISSNTVKENIILSNKFTQKQFNEIYKIDDLIPIQKDDKTIQLFEKTDTNHKNPVFVIAAPVMVDAKGEICDDVKLSILDLNDGFLRVVINTNEEWLNDSSRQYPVSIDPNVDTNQSSSAIQDTFICSGMPNSNNDAMGSMYLGNETTNYKKSRILLKFNLPQFNRGDMVVGAQLCLAQFPGGINPSNANMQVNAYEMKSSWTETTATWNNTAQATENAINGNMLDYYVASSKNNNVMSNVLDITKSVKSWYNGAANNGIVLKADDENASARNIYYSSDYPNGESGYPQLLITFVNNAGLEDHWSCHSQSAGRAGLGCVNDYTGNLVFSTPIMNTTGEKMPMSFSLTYNNYRFSTHFKDQLKGDIFGWGWQSNLSERVDSVKEASGTNAIEKAKFKLLNSQGYRFIYLDADGTEHYFITDPNNSSKIIDEDGLGLEITSGGAGNEYYTIRYSDGSKKTFTASGYLYRIYDNENNYITLSYYGSYLNKVTDGAGRATNIEYSDSGAVTKVTGPDGKITTLNYNGGNLTSIVYPDNKKN